MFRHRDELLTPPHSLRRRQQQQSRHSEAGPPGFDLRSGHVISGTSNQMLDLSICHPSQAFSNRFSVLATPPPMKPSSLSRDFPATSARRARNSRGTKEAKKRRDMRRNRRKLAAQLLDQQLSQAMDATLTKANFPPPPRPCLFPMPQDSVTALPQPADFPSIPPELPLPDFSKFDLAAFSHFTIPSTTPPPLRTPTPFQTLPKWCPKIPSLTLGDVWRDTLPTFHDLSALPEPVEAPSPQPGATQKPCKDLQIWRPIGIGYGRDQSRFFPPRSRSTSEGLGNEPGRGVTVKLPSPVACRLHRSDNGDGCSSTAPVSKSSLSQEILAAFAEIKRTTPLAVRGSELDQSSVPTESCWKNEASEPGLPTIADLSYERIGKSAATMPENVLKASQTFVTAFKKASPCPTGDEQTMDQIEQGCHPSDQHAPDYDSEQPPYELDAREAEIPYVHANSLVGYSNDRDALEILPDYEERQPLADPGVGLPIIIASETHDPVGLNELVVDHDIVAPASVTVAADVTLPISLPATPPATPPLHPLNDMAAILPVDCVTEVEYIHSDAHFCSEQALSSSPLSLAQSAGTLHEGIDASSINIADFLKLGHAKHCWCGHCIDEPYDLARSAANVSISSSATLADRDHAADGDGDSTLSLLLHPSESEPDTESDDPELLKLMDCTCQRASVETAEDDDWLLFSPTATKPIEEPTPSASTTYTPSSPILHRQRQQRAPAPTVIITSSEPSANEPSDDYIAVAAPAAAAASPTATSMAWHDMFPRRSSSMWRAEITACAEERIGLGWAEARKERLGWGRQSEEEWWDWAVEEEC